MFEKASETASLVCFPSSLSFPFTPRLSLFSASRSDPLHSVKMASQVEQIGRAFIQHYYTVFDKDRSQLLPLYQPASLLTFEGEAFRGPQAIVQKFVGLPFKSIQHAVKSVDCAESAAGILVFVTGDLKVEGEANALKFGQVFLLMPTAPNSQNFYVHNDVFRLNYG